MRFVARLYSKDKRENRQTPLKITAPTRIRCTSVSGLQTTFNIPYVYDYVKKLCRQFWWRDSNICIVFSICTSRPTSLVASIKASVLFFMVSVLSPSRELRNKQIAKQTCTVSVVLFLICSSRQFLLEIALDLDDFLSWIGKDTETNRRDALFYKLPAWTKETNKQPP